MSMWIEKVFYTDDFKEGERTRHLVGYECLNCGYFTKEPTKYCPNCGAKNVHDINVGDIEED